MKASARKFFMLLVAAVAAVGGFVLLRGGVAVDMEPSQLVGKTSKQLIADYGRPDMIVPADDSGAADWMYNQGVMGQGLQLRIRNDRVVSVTRQQER